MRIISKFKDYYDYLQGIYGVDNKLIFDRTLIPKSVYLPSSSKYAKLILHIGEWQIDGLCTNRSILFGNEIKEFVKKEKNISVWDSPEKKKEYYIFKPEIALPTLYFLKSPKYLGDKSPTWEYNFPTLSALSIDNRNDNDYSKNPYLGTYSIASFFTPKEAWLAISEWLSKKITKSEKQVPIGDDKVRILSHGFDLKTSFRHKNND